MEKPSPSRLLWFPRGTTAAVGFLLLAAALELGVHRIALFFHKPSHELAEIPNRFKYLVPFATFSLYLLEVTSLLLLVAFSAHILRIRVVSKPRRILLGISLFFSLPVLAINGILIPTHTMGYLLWYYLSALTLFIIFGYSIWLQAAQHHSYRTLGLWYLLLIPSLLLLAARIVSPQAVGFETNHRVSNVLLMAGNYLFIYQGILWPFLILRRRDVTWPPLLAGLAATLALAVALRLAPSVSATVIYGGLRVNLPLVPSGKLLFYLSFWAGTTAIFSLLAMPRWSRILGLSLLLWLLLGFSPYTEVEILPFVLLYLLLLLSMSLRSRKVPPARLSSRAAGPWSEATGVSLHARRSGRYIVLTGEHRGLPLTVTLKKSLFGRVAAYSLTLGSTPDHEPDWIATSLPYVPLSRHLFPSLPRILSISRIPIDGYGLWDRNFFSDALISQESDSAIDTLLDGEIRLWWGSGLTYESPNPPPCSPRLPETLALLTDLAEKALIL